MIPVRIELTNFQSYKNAELEFDFDSALIIGERDNNADVSNGAGKSAVFEAIGWGLFGKSRQKSVDGVVKRGAEYAEVDFTFDHAGERYRIIRRRNARFGKWDVTLFQVQENGTEVQIGSDNNTEINQRIKDIIRSNYDVFLNSCYFKQNRISEFLEGTTGDRQKIISSVLNLDRWNNYVKAAKKQRGEWEKKEDNIEYRLRDFEDLEEELVKASAQLEENEATCRRLQAKEESLTNEIKELENRLGDMRLQESSLNDYHDTVTSLTNSKEKLSGSESKSKEKQVEIQNLSDKITATQGAVAETVRKIQEISSQLDLKSQVDVVPMEQELASLNTEKNLVDNQIESFDGAETCHCCGRLWIEHEEKVAEIEDKKKQSRTLARQIEKCQERVQVAKQMIKKIKEAEIEIEKYTNRKKSLESTLEINSLKLEVSKKDLTALAAVITECEENIGFLEERIAGMQEIEESDTYEKVRRLLVEKKEEKESTLEERNDIMYATGALNEKVIKCKKDKQTKDELKVELQEVKKHITVYQNLERSFGRNGIQAIIIDNVIDELTKVANQWLTEFCYESTFIKFVTQKKDSKGGWKETLDIEVVTPSGVCSFESLSGGEAFRVAFAVILSLGQVQSRRMGGENQLLLLDEVSTSLDTHGLDMFVSIIRKLESDIKVMVVTHDGKLKDEFEHVVRVTKIGNDSTLSII